MPPFVGSQDEGSTAVGIVGSLTTGSPRGWWSKGRDVLCIGFPFGVMGPLTPWTGVRFGALHAFAPELVQGPTMTSLQANA